LYHIFTASYIIISDQCLPVFVQTDRQTHPVRLKTTSVLLSIAGVQAIEVHANGKRSNMLKSTTVFWHN